MGASYVARAAKDGYTLLFTPNFCPVSEYATAFAAHADAIVDGPDVLLQAPDIFAGRSVGLRIDPGAGLGHHDKVRTAGAHTKFGHPLDDVDSFLAIAAQVGVKVVGLHAHVGSGILDAGAWARTAQVLEDEAEENFFDHGVRVVCWIWKVDYLAASSEDGHFPSMASQRFCISSGVTFSISCWSIHSWPKGSRRQADRWP